MDADLWLSRRERSGRGKPVNFPLWCRLPVPLPPQMSRAWRQSAGAFLEKTQHQWWGDDSFTEPCSYTTNNPLFWHLSPWHRVELVGVLIVSGLFVEGKPLPPEDVAHRQCYEAIFEFLLDNLLPCELDDDPGSDSECEPDFTEPPAPRPPPVIRPSAPDREKIHLETNKYVALGAAASKEELKAKRARAKAEGMLDQSELEAAAAAATAETSAQDSLDSLEAAQAMIGRIKRSVDAARGGGYPPEPTDDDDEHSEELSPYLWRRHLYRVTREASGLSGGPLISWKSHDEDLWTDFYCMSVLPVFRDSIPDDERPLHVSLDPDDATQGPPAVRELVERKATELTDEFNREWSRGRTFRAYQAIHVMTDGRYNFKSWCEEDLYWEPIRQKSKPTSCDWIFDFSLAMSEGLDRKKDRRLIQQRFDDFSHRVAALNKLQFERDEDVSKYKEFGEDIWQGTPEDFVASRGLKLPLCENYGCKNDGKRVCSACRVMRFCSAECQKAMWEKHKPVCKLIQSGEYKNRNGPVLHKCGHCGKRGNELKKCGRCLKVMFCSRECQVSAWKTHKLNCKTT